MATSRSSRLARPATADKRQQLLASARELFGARGYAATSTHAIAKHAGVSQALVYRHFPSKAELFVEAVFDPFVELLDSFVEQWDISDADASIDGITRNFAAALYSRVRGERQLLLAAVTSHVLTGGADSERRAIEATVARMFARIEAEHIRAGRSHNLLHLDPPLTVRMTFAVVFAAAVFDDWLLPSLSERPDDQSVLEDLGRFVAWGATGRPALMPIDLSRTAFTATATVVAVEAGIEQRAHGQRPAGSVRPLLLAAARDLFLDNGFAATSTRQIAHHARVAESLLFHHFATKADLFTAAVVQPLISTLSTFGADDHASAPLEQIVIDLYDRLRAERAALDAVISSNILQNPADNNTKAIQTELRRVFDRTAKHLVDVAAGKPDAALMARLIFGLAFSVAVLEDLLLAGLEPAPGRERLTTEMIRFALSGATRR